MAHDAIALRHAANRRLARIRELTGRDERSVTGTDTACALQLLDRLVDFPPDDTGEKFSAAELTASDRDLVLAQVYRRAFGDRISSTLTCAGCSKPFDLHFSLQELAGTLLGRNRRASWKHLGGRRFEAPKIGRFRLPVGQDELDAAGLEPRAAEALLFGRCAEGRRPRGGAKALQEMLDEVAPLMDLDLSAPCPECGHAQAVQFDIQGYLLGAIMAERRQLSLEIHTLASAYGWSLDEVLSLPRGERRQLVEIVEDSTPGRFHWSR